MATISSRTARRKSRCDLATPRSASVSTTSTRRSVEGTPKSAAIRVSSSPSSDPSSSPLTSTETSVRATSTMRSQSDFFPSSFFRNRRAIYRSLFRFSFDASRRHEFAVADFRAAAADQCTTRAPRLHLREAKTLRPRPADRAGARRPWRHASADGADALILGPGHIGTAERECLQHFVNQFLRTNSRDVAEVCRYVRAHSAPILRCVFEFVELDHAAGWKAAPDTTRGTESFFVPLLQRQTRLLGEALERNAQDRDRLLAAAGPTIAGHLLDRGIHRAPC